MKTMSNYEIDTYTAKAAWNPEHRKAEKSAGEAICRNLLKPKC